MIIATLCCLSTALAAQEGPAGGMGGNSVGIGNITPNYLIQRNWIVAGKVMTLGGDPVPGVKVLVQPTVAAAFRVLTTDQQGEFQTVYALNTEMVKEFGVAVTANKKGFLKAQEMIDYGDGAHPYALSITLRDAKPDPAVLAQEEMVSALAARLKNLGPADGLSGKSEKDYARGVEEFVVLNRADRALGSFTKVLARDEPCVGCRTMLGLAELASGDWDGAIRNFSQGVDDVRNAAKSQPSHSNGAAGAPPRAGRPEPALALGVMESWRHQLERALGFFQEALNIAPQDPLALQEIGRVELLMQNWTTADTYLGRAEAAGAFPQTRLLRAEALLGGGDFDAANQEMTRYLDGRDVKTMPLPVRQTWARIAEKKKIEVVYVKAKSKGNPPIDYLHGAIPELKDIVPATDQSPLDSVLTAVGKKVEVYFRNFPNTVSVEQIHQEKLSRKGKAGETLNQKFHYLCLAPKEETGLAFTEYRSGLSGDLGQPQGLSDGFMLTSGFASASLVFHPVYQAESTFRYLGRQKIDGRDTLVLAFAQRPEKARLNGEFKMGQTTMPTFSQGLAWVDSETYEILRLRTDLLRPLPEVRLEKETTEIDFGENHFKSMAEAFWLPREVKVSVDWNGKCLLNKHEYSDFKLFNVGASEKIEKPKEVEQASREKGAPQGPN
jgi:tetratricopeptide (TPR) repeat protein